MQYHTLATSKSFNAINNFPITDIPALTDATQQARSRQSFPARVEFCPTNNDLYGAVNCLLHADRTRKNKGFEPELTTQPTPNRKLGPILLEIRQLFLHSGAGSFDRNEEASQGGLESAKKLSAQNRRYSGFSGRLIAVSRGIVSSSVSSTCLTFRKDNHWRNGLHDELADMDELQCATGLSNGVLCVHTFKNLNSYMQEGSAILDSALSDDSVVSYYQYHQRHNRPVSAVSWRNGAVADYSRHVAMGLTSVEKGMNPTSTPSGAGPSNIDHEYGCMVWDIEGQSGAKGSKQSPFFRLAHNVGVSSLTWVEGGQLLAVGTQGKNIQLYDLRASGTNSPPISILAHKDVISGIEGDQSRPSLFASFSRTLGEPVKIWDVRKPDTFVSEIKVNSASSAVQNSPVTAVSWVPLNPGSLCIAAGEILRYFDTRSNVSKPILTKITHMTESVQSMAFQAKDATFNPHKNMDQITPCRMAKYERMIVVNREGEVKDLPLEQSSPLSISHRDGRIANAFGPNTWTSPSAFEGDSAFNIQNDISTIMNRRAMNFNAFKNEIPSSRGIWSMLQCSTVNLHNAINTRHDSHSKNLWEFIDRVESLISCESGSTEESSLWTGRSLIDCGILRLLLKEEKRETLPSKKKDLYKTLDSPIRRAALEACGWSTKNTDDRNFERNAALAVWHGNIQDAVETLSDGSAYIRRIIQSDIGNDISRPPSSLTSKYSEALDLLSVCVAGYNASAVQSLSWTQACYRLSKREEFNSPDDTTHSPYIRALCTFLLNSGDPDSSNMILNDESLSLVDRIAFACSFLDQTTIINFLNTCLHGCFQNGNLDGLILTGLDKSGFALLQAYMDKTADVQTVAIISSLVLLPNDWVFERSLHSEWIGCYRDLLNSWQMWQYRAKFDVYRAERMRKLKRNAEDAATNIASGSASRGNIHPPRRSSVNNNQTRKVSTVNSNRPSDADVTVIPPQLHARCNYCNTSLPLMMMRRNESMAKLWISRQKPNSNEQKPILSSCPNPQCRKPLPRCAVCLLPLGCLNPYLEMKKIGRTGLTGGDDYSDLANLPFAEWFTWCMKCKHGGHAHHIVGWFANHGETCPVSGCNCRCQSDAIQKLSRLGAKRQDDN